MAPSKASKASKPAPKAPKPDHPLTTAYLTLYNFVSAILWLTVLGRVVSIAAVRGPSFVSLATESWTRWTQTAALLEVVHSLVGLVRAPVSTTLMQVSSRILLVWGIVYPFPFLARTETAYTTMLLAWSTVEVIRYMFFAVTRATGADSVPTWLLWLRYSAFYVLYPVGITSECLMIWAAVPFAGQIRPELSWVLYGILAIYVPGSYIMFTHMMGQRKKVLRAARADSKKRQ